MSVYLNSSTWTSDELWHLLIGDSTEQIYRISELASTQPCWLVPVDPPGALLLALNAIVMWEWRGVPNEEDNYRVTWPHVSLSRMTMSVSVWWSPSPRGASDTPCLVYQCYTFPSDWAAAAATKTTRPNYSIFSDSNPPFPGAAILMCGKTGGEWEMMRHNKRIMLHFLSALSVWEKIPKLYPEDTFHFSFLNIFGW